MSRHKSVASDDLFPEDVDSLRLARKRRRVIVEERKARLCVASRGYDVRNLVELLRPSSAASVS
jgi:hypothetical protein